MRQCLTQVFEPRCPACCLQALIAQHCALDADLLSAQEQLLRRDAAFRAVQDEQYMKVSVQAPHSYQERVTSLEPLHLHQCRCLKDGALQNPKLYRRTV